ncbi:MAG: sugar phosphate isomerase/epimerase family protein [Acidobacteriaceae bacterium]
MERRKFLGAAAAAALTHVAALAYGDVGTAMAGQSKGNAIEPMELGLLIKPAKAPEETIRRVHDLGFKTCFLSLDDYIGQFTPSAAERIGDLLSKYAVRATTVEVVGPPPLEWNFLRGPSTIGLVPRATRAARIAALTGVSDFAKKLGVPQVQTHCGFIPENPADPLYAEAVAAIREVAMHCQANGQSFLMETGQETPTTMSRTLRDVGQPNLGVGLDTANLILYGKANPVDAVDILGPHVKSIHAKDGRWPTNPNELGEEVLIGSGLVDFKQVFSRLKRAGYTGAVTIERETSGPQQIEDVRKEKLYLEQVLAQI